MNRRKFLAGLAAVAAAPYASVIGNDWQLANVFIAGTIDTDQLSFVQEGKTLGNFTGWDFRGGRGVFIDNLNPGDKMTIIIRNVTKMYNEFTTDAVIKGKSDA